MLSELAAAHFADAEYLGTSLHRMMIMGLVMQKNFFRSWQGE